MLRVSLLLSSFAIAPRLPDQEGKVRIEVFNPCDGSDDQKTPTAILFDDDKQFIDFGVNAIQKYAEIVEDGASAYLFQNVFSLKLSTKCTYFICIHQRNLLMEDKCL